MNEKKKLNRQDRIHMGIYSTSMGISLTALSIIAALEVIMLIYTVVNPAMYGPYIAIYRRFYIALLSVAVVCIALNLYMKKDIAHRFGVLSAAYPLCAVFFFGWAFGITYFDAVKYQVVDPAVFMTFSLTVPLTFYLLPAVYAAIVITADAVMLYLTVSVSGSMALIINLSIFFIFQLVLGISFLRLKKNLAERIVEEEDNADIDVMTGLSNRRVYEEDMQALAGAPLPDDLVYIAIDINGLKEVNDEHGHEAGDRLIIGTARCLEQTFGGKGRMYRIGGDEFVVTLNTDLESLIKTLVDFETRMQLWSEQNGLSLSTANGYVCRFDFPDSSITELAREADRRMYAAKARHYTANGRDRRRFTPEAH